MTNLALDTISGWLETTDVPTNEQATLADAISKLDTKAYGSEDGFATAIDEIVTQQDLGDFLALDEITKFAATNFANNDNISPVLKATREFLTDNGLPKTVTDNREDGPVTVNIEAKLTDALKNAPTSTVGSDLVEGFFEELQNSMESNAAKNTVRNSFMNDFASISAAIVTFANKIIGIKTEQDNTAEAKLTQTNG